MKKCIVFDIDRTIVDSYLPELISLQEAIENVTGKMMNEEQMKKLTSLPTTDFYKYINLSDEEIKLVNKEWEKTFGKYKTKCFPGIKEIITKLYKEGVIIAIITSRTEEEFHELDNELIDVLDYFKVVVTSDLIQKPKPNRDSIDYLCNKLNISSENILYIGDNEVDKELCQNCNISFIPACWENKELENEDNACNSVEELYQTIKRF